MVKKFKIQPLKVVELRCPNCNDIVDMDIVGRWNGWEIGAVCRKCGSEKSTRLDGFGGSRDKRKRSRKVVLKPKNRKVIKK